LESLGEYVDTPAQVAPTSIECLKLRPNFQSPLDPKQHKLAEVLTDYSFERQAPCGLSTCQQGHFRGFLVRTESGVETNIGHVCGKKHFGVDFDTASAKYRREEERRVTVGRLRGLQGESPRVLHQIRELMMRRFGVRWMFSVRDAVRAQVGGPGFEHLKARSFKRDYTVIRVKERTESEIQAEIKRSGGKRDELRYMNERLGEIAPLEWTSWDLKAELLVPLRDEFQALSELDPSQMETKDLKRRLKRFDGWELRIPNAESILSQVIRFLDTSNLRVVDLALEEFRVLARISTPLPCLSKWSGSAEYAQLLTGAYREGQVLG